MDDCIIEIDDIKITWYKDFIESGCKKIAVFFSGGVDSSLVLWFLCYFLDKAQIYDVEIYTYYLRNCGKRIPSKSNSLRKIIETFHNQFPKVNLKPLDVFTYWAYSPWTRMSIHIETITLEKEQVMNKRYGIDWFINGINLGFTENEFIELGISKELYDTRDRRRDINRILTGIDTEDYFLRDIKKRSPLYQLNKKIIKKLYKKYNLLDTLYPMTISCMADENPFPCKKCFWCVEKYAIFGSYDGGIQ